MSEYLTINSLAALVGRTPKAIQKMVERHQIPYRKHNKRVVFKRSEAERFFDRGSSRSIYFVKNWR